MLKNQEWKVGVVVACCAEQYEGKYGGNGKHDLVNQLFGSVEGLSIKFSILIQGKILG